MKTLFFLLVTLALSLPTHSIAGSNPSHLRGSIELSEDLNRRLGVVECQKQDFESDSRKESAILNLDFQGDSSEGCCKVCTRGQACGNSCISWEKKLPSASWLRLSGLVIGLGSHAQQPLLQCAVNSVRSVLA